MTTQFFSENQELNDIMRFEGINYMKVFFTGNELKDKKYKLTVKEIWDGKLKEESVVFDSKSIGIRQFEMVNDTVLKIKVIAKHTYDNKLKMTFMFPNFEISSEYDAIDSDAYSLRNIAQESKMEIGYNKKFYFLAYILPYEKEGGVRAYCEVGSAGKDIETWGEKFGIKHYLIFEMLFE